MTDRYYLFMRAQNVASITRLNHAIIAADLSGDGLVTAEPVDVWVKPERNLLEVELRWPQGREFSPGQASYEALLYIADPDCEYPQPGTELASFRWPAPMTTDREEHYPHRHAQFVFYPVVHNTRLWEEAEPLGELGEDDRQQIVQLVDRLRGALAGGQPEQVYQLLSYRYAEEARAEGKDEDRIRAAVLDGYQDLYSMDNLDFPPVDAAALHLDPHGDGLVVHVTREAHGPAVLARDPASGLTFGIPIFMARVGAAWTIVR